MSMYDDVEREARHDWLDEREQAEAEMLTPRRECVACGRACPPGQRWCSTTCFLVEDGDDRDWDEPDADEPDEEGE